VSVSWRRRSKTVAKESKSLEELKASLEEHETALLGGVHELGPRKVAVEKAEAALAREQGKLQSGLRDLEFAGPAFPGGVSSVDLPFTFASRSIDRRGPFLKLSLLARERGLCLLHGNLARSKFVDAAEEGRLVLFQARLQFLQGLGFLRDGLLLLSSSRTRRSSAARFVAYSRSSSSLRAFRSSDPAPAASVLSTSPSFFRFHRLLAFVE